MDNRQLVEFSVDWASRLATHRDRRVLACELNQQPVGPLQGLVGCLKQAAEGECRETFAPGTLLPDRDPALVRHIPRARFDAHFAGQHTQPAVGRYYPKAMIAGALGCSRRELAPFHLIGMQGEQLVVDLNHPLAGLELNLSARKRDQPPAGSVPLVDAAAIPRALVENGPGMQAGADRAEASFFAAYPFTRDDPQEDAVFYRNPRLVPHLDATASAEVSAIYSRFLEPGMRVLDLMSSWVSHLPASKNDISLTGLGMNRQELASNTLLNDYLI
ncbi:methyltransferase domain-containing protein, partial [Thiogranum longum]